MHDHLGTLSSVRWGNLLRISINAGVVLRFELPMSVTYIRLNGEKYQDALVLSKKCYYTMYMYGYVPITFQSFFTIRFGIYRTVSANTS